MTPEINAVSGMDTVGRKALLNKDEIKVCWAYSFFKRLFDIVASLVAMVVLSPLFLVVALAVFLDDPHGSPFYSQQRVGKDGKPFKLWKFRSMVVNAEELREELEKHNEKDGPVFKIKDDPRITRVGRFIRKTSIDELPQFWNVLKGEMSIVGPRPPLPSEVAEYGEYELQRLMVTPGLTCYWQTRDNRDMISFNEWVDMDIQYIRERSVWLDMKLIFLTVKVVLSAQGN